MEEKEYYRQCIEAFQQEEQEKRRGKIPLGGTYLGVLLYAFVTLLYLSSYELAGMVAIFQDTGEVVLPTLVVGEGFIGVNLSYGRGGHTLWRANNIIENVMYLSMIWTYTLFSVENDVRNERELSGKSYLLVAITTFFLHIFVSLGHMAEKKQLPLELASLEAVNTFESLLLWSGFPCFFMALGGIFYTMITGNSLLRSPWKENLIHPCIYIFETILFCGGLRFLGLGVLHILGTFLGG